MKRLKETVFSDKNGMTVVDGSGDNLQLWVTGRKVDEILLHPFSTHFSKITRTVPNCSATTSISAITDGELVQKIVALRAHSN